MKCFHPIDLKHPKNSRVIIPVPCGKCAACITNKRNDWALRLNIELRASQTAHFVTLTYSDAHLPKNYIPDKNGEIIGDLSTLRKSDFQKFMKKLRKKNVNKLTYFCVGEYGEKSWRPHYHLLLFNLDSKWREKKLELMLLETWDLGRIDVGTITPASIRYCTNYIVQKNGWSSDTLIQKPFALMSKGIGKSYIEHHKKHDFDRNCIILENGVRAKMPRYFRDKLYPPDTQVREIMADRAYMDGQRAEYESWQEFCSGNKGRFSTMLEARRHYEALIIDRQEAYQQKQDSNYKKNSKL